MILEELAYRGCAIILVGKTNVDEGIQSEAIIEMGNVHRRFIVAHTCDNQMDQYMNWIE